jgi:hypothetical protein
MHCMVRHSCWCVRRLPTAGIATDAGSGYHRLRSDWPLAGMCGYPLEALRMGVSGDDSGLIRGDSETSPDDAKPSIFDHGGLR